MILASYSGSVKSSLHANDSTSISELDFAIYHRSRESTTLISVTAPTSNSKHANSNERPCVSACVMPAYFYHISLELLPSGPPHLHDSFHPSTADPTLILRAAREALRPFRKKRPKSAKEVSATRSSAAASLSRNNNNSESGGKQQQATTTITATTNSAARPCPQSSLSDSQTSTTYILPYPATLPEQISTDQRLDQISIECMDMVADPNRGDSQQQQQQQRQNPRKDTSSNSNNNNQITKGIGTSALGGLATKGKYVSLDQKLSESIWGIVHLYRDGEESPTLCDGDDDPSFLKGSAIARTSRISAPGTRNHFGSQNAFGTSSSSASAAVGASAYASSYSRANTAGAGFAGSASSASGGGDAPPPPEDCTTLCILAVPSYLSPADFVGLVGDETRDEVSHFRMIRTARANRYMVLMKFRSARKAREWQKEWNGKVFNSMEVS
jgi:BRCA1-associated protein